MTSWPRWPRACQHHRLRFGLYLSPWDRHQSSWATDHQAYDRLYLQQLTELCSNYGDLCEVWFDGAGSEQHPYDWDAIMQVVETLQPQAMVFNMGRPTIRWVSNEDGLASDPCWYVVDATHTSLYDAAPTNLAEVRYLPPECDVAIRRHWFWHADDTDTLKSRQHLEAIWYRSIGLGANLLLNVPLDTRGLLDDADRDRLIEFGKTMQERFVDPIHVDLAQAGSIVTATFPSAVTIDHLWLEEAIEAGQWVRHHRVMLADRTPIAGGFTIGSLRVHVFPAVTTDRLVIDLSDPDARLSAVRGFRTGIEQVPELEDQPDFAAHKMD